MPQPPTGARIHRRVAVVAIYIASCAIAVRVEVGTIVGHIGCTEDRAVVAAVAVGVGTGVGVLRIGIGIVGDPVVVVVAVADIAQSVAVEVGTVVGHIGRAVDRAVIAAVAVGVGAGVGVQWIGVGIIRRWCETWRVLCRAGWANAPRKRRQTRAPRTSTPC